MRSDAGRSARRSRVEEKKNSFSTKKKPERRPKLITQLEQKKKRKSILLHSRTRSPVGSASLPARRRTNQASPLAPRIELSRKNGALPLHLEACAARRRGARRRRGDARADRRARGSFARGQRCVHQLHHPQRRRRQAGEWFRAREQQAAAKAVSFQKQSRRREANGHWPAQQSINGFASSRERRLFTFARSLL